MKLQLQLPVASCATREKELQSKRLGRSQSKDTGLQNSGNGGNQASRGIGNDTVRLLEIWDHPSLPHNWLMD